MSIINTDTITKKIDLCARFRYLFIIIWCLLVNVQYPFDMFVCIMFGRAQ